MMAFYHTQEGVEPHIRQEKLWQRLHEQVDYVRQHSRFYQTLYKDVDPNLSGRALQEALPLLHKSALPAQQSQDAPFGNINSVPLEKFVRLFASPGPIYEGAMNGDYWRLAQALFAASIEQNDIIQNCFSYHFTPAGMMVEGGAQALGIPVIPAGVGNSDLQVQVMAHYGASSYCGTPDFLKIILEKADAMQIALPKLKKGMVSGGPFFPALRDDYQQRGLVVTQCLAAADVGLMAFEIVHEGKVIDDGQVVAEDIILELIDPNSGCSIENPDEIGEIVVTRFCNQFPLIRYATGDLSMWHKEKSPCGRTNQRIKGWMGRVDMTTKIKGMFVHPSQIEKALADYQDALHAFSLQVNEQGGHDEAILHIVTKQAGDEKNLQSQLEISLQAHCRLKIKVKKVDSLPDDAKIIEDKRQLS